MQEAVRTNHSALTSLKLLAAQLREEKDEAERKAEEMKLKYQELETGNKGLQDKLRLYSGDDGTKYGAFCSLDSAISSEGH